jgi:mycothiol synthase
VIGCAGIHRDIDRPERGENALTAVRRDWRGRGIASHNEHLGYVRGHTSITMSRPLPM